MLVWKRPEPQKHVLEYPPIHLYGHDAAVKCIFVSTTFSLIATGSADGTCILWDSNRLTYRYTLPHSGSVVAVCVSDQYGDVYTLEELPSSQQFVLHLWSINGEHIRSRVCEQQGRCMQISNNFAGVNPNVVAVGNANGSVSLFDSTTLQLVNILQMNKLVSVSAIAFSGDCHHIYTGDINGQVIDWYVDEGANPEAVAAARAAAAAAAAASAAAQQQQEQQEQQERQ